MDLSFFGKAAAVASVLTVTNPVEIIKLRLQTAHELFATGRIKENYSSITQCVTSMVEKEGFKSFWKGNTVGILRFFPNEFINFKSRGFYQGFVNNAINTNLMVAVLAGWTASSILYPFDILRQAMGTNTDRDTKTLKAIQGILRNQGSRYFYKGYINSLLNTAVFRASFNGSYDSVKSSATSINEKIFLAYLCSAFAGGVCYPIDVVRKRRIFLNSTDGCLPQRSGSRRASRASIKEAS
jgi:solute carrier family 25 (adenine nucleotide translocator) protein 4/5/6/31